jgi:hypothetical protein
MTPDQVRNALSPSVTPLTDAQASSLADWYTALAAQLALLPEAELKATEPPLRSTPAPR